MANWKFSSSLFPDTLMGFIFLCILQQNFTVGLKCIQCNTLERNYRLGHGHNAKLDMSQCYEGRIEPNSCPDQSHTHCIIYYVRNIQTEKMIVLWRKCGNATDISHPCQTYNVGPDAVSELYHGAPGSYKRVRFRALNKSLDRVPEHRRRSLVQICVAGCTHDGCLVDSARRNVSPMLLFVFVFFLVACCYLHSSLL